MTDPIRMVYVSLFSIILVLSTLFFYRFVYPRKRINPLFIVLALSIPPIVSIFRVGTYESGDFNIHIYRIMSFYDSLREGILIPSWAGELNATYGNPLFIFNYSLPYYLVSFFHVIGFSFISSMKLFLGLNLFLSGIFMYMFVKKLTNNSLAAFTSSIFYVFNPYHLIDIHFRATLGESTVFTLLPLLFFFITKYIKQKRFFLLPVCAIIMGLLFLAHPLLAIVALGIAVVYSVFLNRINKINYKSFVLLITSLFAGTLSTAYTWAPFILYSRYMFPNPGSSISFAPFYQHLFSPWRYGLLFQGPYGELALIIGYTQLFVVIATIFLLIKKNVSKRLRKPYLFWILLFSSFIFLIHGSSAFIWRLFPIFSMLLPTGRLLLVIAFITSVIAGYFSLSFSNSKSRRIFIYILLAITIGSTILNWGHRRVIPEINDEVLRQNVWSSTTTEGITAYFLNNKWADIDNFWFSEKPATPITILSGKATVKEIERTSTYHSYVVQASTSITIQENTLYFPGWTLTDNGSNIQIYPGERGVISASLSQGLHYVELTYQDLLEYRILKILGVGLFSLFILTFVFIYGKRSYDKKS